MAVKMRLKRMGAKKAPFYRVVVADSRSPRDGKFIALIGTYNPLVTPAEIKINEEEALNWLSKGAIPTDTVKNILSKVGIMEIIHLEKQDFNDLIKEKVLVDFYANWCGPCKMLAPVLEEAESDLKVIKVDTDEFEELSQEYGVMTIPTLILFDKGKEVKRNIGFINKDEVEEFLK